MRFFISLIVMAFLVFICSTVYGGTWSAGMGSDYETFQAKLIYSPDPNGGVGLVFVGDSFVPEDSETENLALGPTLRFNLGDLANAAANRILPGSWAPLANAPVRVYGTLDFLWQVDGGQFTFAMGTQCLFFPDWVVSPFVQLTYFRPIGQNDAEDGPLMQEDFKAILGAEYRFK